MSAEPRLLGVEVDMGESFGRWRLGDDPALMPYLSSANIACGFHAGDPVTIRATVRAALRHVLQLGAHVALPDLLGVGRRRMAVDATELRDYCVFQIGALRAFVDAEGGALGHVKPHGTPYAMCSAEPELAGAVAAAVAEVDSRLDLLLLDDRSAAAVAAHGIRPAREAFVDLEYEQDGSLVIEHVKQPWDPERVAARAVRLVRARRIDTRHGDTPSTLPPCAFTATRRTRWRSSARCASGWRQ
jgi:5-oxoprolinase (ATP-hydrolysing) subunit A